MTPALRAATDRDWPAAWRIQRAGFDALVRQTNGGWDWAAKRRCKAEWDPAQTQIIEDGGRMIGWVRARTHPDYDWLDLIVVDPRVHGQGIGTWVMEGLMRRAQARGVPLCLSVYRMNLARSLYLRLGFAEYRRDELRRLMVYPAEAGPRDPRGGAEDLERLR